MRIYRAVYRKRAEECRRMAEEPGRISNRVQWLRLAEAWTMLARVGLDGAEASVHFPMPQEKAVRNCGRLDLSATCSTRSLKRGGDARLAQALRSEILL
jgi:hypothetical protein